MSCSLGAAQTHGTCWFYTILNGLLMSEGGQKLLYEKMLAFYKGLTPEEKSFFKDGIDAPCPRGLAFKPIYFYKFLDQYFCFMSGPRNIKVKAGLSPQLLNNSLPVKNIHKGGQPKEHFLPILRRLGFDESEYQVINGYNNLKVLGEKVALKPKLIISNFIHVRRPNAIRGYELMCASIELDDAVGAGGHAIAGYVCNGRPYLIDSNFMKPIPCKWWNDLELEKAFKTINQLYSGKFMYPRIEYSVYVRRSALYRIHPACLLKYKNANVKSNIKTPAVQSAIKRQDARYSVLKFLFPKKKVSFSPSVLPVPNSKSPIRTITRSRGKGKPRKKVPYSRVYTNKNSIIKGFNVLRL